jgi:GNAT superfamily N-acetyltransferase
MNCLLFYYDENDHSVAFITPHLKEINREIQELPFTPLLIMEWPADRWFQQPRDFQDMSMYGTNTTYPTMSLSRVNLIVPNREMVPSLIKMFTTPSFAKSYFGCAYQTKMESITKMTADEFVESALEDFGRRAGIDWFITDKKNNFVGFIHLTQKYVGIPNKWVLEFGVRPECQGQGIMSEVLPAVVSFARREGCDEPIYAVSEVFNTACHKLFRKFPNVQEQRASMNNMIVGGRDIFILPYV